MGRYSGMKGVTGQSGTSLIFYSRQKENISVIYETVSHAKKIFFFSKAIGSGKDVASTTTCQLRLRVIIKVRKVNANNRPVVAFYSTWSVAAFPS